jgi:hypothetical protein
MGTPESNDFLPRSKRAFDFGRSFTKRFCSRCIRDWRRVRSGKAMALQEIGRLAESRYDGEEIKIFTTEVTEDTGQTGADSLREPREL